MTKTTKKVDIESGKPPTDWKSIYIATVVAFLSSLQLGSIIPTIWPYLKLIRPSITENTYGIMRGSSSFANIISAGITGYLANVFKNSKYLLIVGKIVGALGSICYLMIELELSAALFLFFMFEIFHGLGMGITSVYRTHIAMNTTEAERSRGFGLAAFAFALGFALGPLFQMGFTLFGYPGIEILFGIHWNLFTAPVFLSFVTSIIGILLLFFFFNGKLHVKSTNKKKSTVSPIESESSTTSITDTVNSIDEINKIDEIKYDKIAVIIMIILKVVTDINLLCIMSISSPYTMTAFSWTSKQAVSYQSAMMAGTGTCSLVIALGYMFFNMDKRISERMCLIIGFTVFLTFYIVTYPWPMITETIPYEHIQGGQVYYTQEEAFVAKESLITENTTYQVVGCPVDYNWCEGTPRVNPYLYMITLVFAVGISVPLTHINLDILYSKILGPIKQGLHQAVFFASGQILNILGPVIMTRIYTISGPKYLWMFEILSSTLCIIGLFIFYNRLIPYNQRVENKLQKQSKNNNFIKLSTLNVFN